MDITRSLRMTFGLYLQLQYHFFWTEYLYHSGFAFSSFNGVLVLLCVIFLTCVCCPRLCSRSGWLLLEFSAIGIGFNGAETSCGVARALGVLLMNTWGT